MQESNKPGEEQKRKKEEEVEKEEVEKEELKEDVNLPVYFFFTFFIYCFKYS